MLVYYICLYFLTKLNPTMSQFNEHIDLQKVAEIMFKNEKYNVLKPTIHIIKDHFVEFIQKRHNIDTSERMFLDRNGLRHIWKGLEIPRLKNLRKADVTHRAIDDKNANNNITAAIDTDIKKSNKKDNRHRKGNKRARKTTTTAVPEPIRPSLRDDEVVVKTTFFCPFFGVVRMSTRVHKFEENENITRRFNTIND
ncbi:uncharacterized protein LOC123878150 [Maniola jurtina]|uniref:uncharacterized protein LOC123878150 n=1 Tax=Maniola jurtina TaxID=191418 RepID=UPI001E68D527|nr:uncharacterized protein LOC123878150 [Maniola jurtina]